MIGKIFGKSASRRRRRFLVLAMYFGLAGFAGSMSLAGLAERYEDAWGVGSLGTLLGFLSFLFLLTSVIVFSSASGTIRASTQRVADKKENELDERQRAVRDRAYRLAYQILSGVLAAAAIHWLFATSFLEGWLWLPGEEGFFLVVVAVWLIQILPTSIVAWNEPDPEEE